MCTLFGECLALKQSDRAIFQTLTDIARSHRIISDLVARFLTVPKPAAQLQCGDKEEAAAQ